MIYLPSEAKLWYTGCRLCSLSCSSWYSPRLPGYFSDDVPLLLSWIFRGYNGFLGSSWTFIQTLEIIPMTRSYILYRMLDSDAGNHQYSLWFKFITTLSFVQMIIPLTLRVSSSSHLPSPNFQPLAGIAATWPLSSGFTRAAPLEFSQTTLHWSNLSNNNGSWLILIFRHIFKNSHHCRELIHSAPTILVFLSDWDLSFCRLPSQWEMSLLRNPHLLW